jgi:hypothetical protein
MLGKIGCLAVLNDAFQQNAHVANFLQRIQFKNAKHRPRPTTSTATQFVWISLHQVQLFFISSWWITYRGAQQKHSVMSCFFIEQRSWGVPFKSAFSFTPAASMASRHYNAVIFPSSYLNNFTACAHSQRVALVELQSASARKIHFYAFWGKRTNPGSDFSHLEN